MLSLGTFPSVSLAQVRLRRDAVRARLANGIDPSASRQEEKGSRCLALAPVPPFRSVAEIWMPVRKYPKSRPINPAGYS